MNDRSKFLMRGLLHSYYWCDEGLQNSLRSQGFKPLSRTKSMIMVNIADGISRPTELARNIGISRQAIQQTLAELEEAGLVTLRTDPTDGRAKIVQFSEEGKSIGRAAFKAMSAMEGMLEERLGPGAIKQLNQILFADWGPIYMSGQDATEPASRDRRGRRRKA